MLSSTSPLPAPLWCKQTVKPQGLGQWLPPQHLLCNWFSLKQAGGRDGFPFLSLPLRPSPYLHSVYIKPQPWKSRTVPCSNELWERTGGGGRCYQWMSKEVTSGSRLGLWLCMYTYKEYFSIHFVSLGRFCPGCFHCTFSKGKYSNMHSIFHDVSKIRRGRIYLLKGY